MSQYERLVMMAEDELTNYSTDGRKMQKLRQKIGLSVSRTEQESVKTQLKTELPEKGFVKLVETQRQAMALPLWGIAGLGLLFGISAAQPADFAATVAGAWGAIALQRWGWKLEAKRLVLNTLEEIEVATKNPA
jgi:hypothetical protein